MGKKIFSFKEGIKKFTEQIIIAVSPIYENEIEKHLKDNQVANYCFFSNFKMKITKKKYYQELIILEPIKRKYVGLKKSIDGKGIIDNSKIKKSYPEVTGYYIPTLIRWEYRKLAIAYTDWLCSIQKEDESWYDILDEAPYIFDSVQILKGLLAVRRIYPNKVYLDNIIKKRAAFGT